VARGAVWADTAADAVAASQLTVVCVMDAAAMGVVLDPLDETLRGRALVNLTSTTPDQARQRAAWASESGIAYLDGAIMTPTPSIGQDTALVLYSGGEAAYDAHRQTLANLGGTPTYLGDDPGRASAYDVALLDMFWTSVSGLVHGLALARAEGVTASALAPYARQVFGLLPDMGDRFARHVDDGHHPGERSTIDSAAAGIAHIRRTGKAHGMDTGSLAAALAIVRRAIDDGHGSDGLSRLVEVIGETVATG
jgi:3-hydroxyisobutyrate dehydrogenase-like beta-hydroxyacid dehydrogenase